MLNRVGQQLGNYRLLRLLGSGGFAEVYLGEHIYLNSRAAIKVLKGHLSEEDRQLFSAEARLLAKLTHPSIVKVLEFGIDQEDVAFLVLDYLPRGTLRARHPSGSRLALDLISFYVKHIAIALQYAHEQKIIHRDIKPENILVGSTHQVLLSDFGISLFVLSEKPGEEQGVIGTYPYMAPEVFAGRPEFASDQYALGIMVYEWLCGRRPFQGVPFALAYQHTQVPPPSLCDQDPSLPREVERVVFKALAKEPRERYLSVQHFAQALAQASQRRQTQQAPLSKEQQMFLAERAFDALPAGRVLLLEAPADQPLAARLTEDLSQQGMLVWQARVAESPEQLLKDMELRHLLRATDQVVVIISDAFHAAERVQPHLRLVQEYRRPLVCLSMTRMAPASLLPPDWPAALPFQLLDARQEAYQDLLASLLTQLERPEGGEGTAQLELVGEPRSPYKGLRPFALSDADDFFGQERLIEELLQKVRAMASRRAESMGRLLAVIGPSGSGKSAGPGLRTGSSSPAGPAPAATG